MSMLKLRHCPPPHKFRAAGEVISATFSDPPSFIKPRKLRGKRADGIRYEKKIQKLLQEHLGDFYIPSKWIKFTNTHDKGRINWCQPDGIIVDPRRSAITVVEIKLKHTADAWWQVRELYIPALKKIFGPEWIYLACEITKWFDPHTRFPEWATILDDVSEVKKLSSNAFHILVWNE